MFFFGDRLVDRSHDESPDDKVFDFLNNLQDKLNDRCPLEYLESANKYMDSMRAAVKKIKEVSEKIPELP